MGRAGQGEQKLVSEEVEVEKASARHASAGGEEEEDVCRPRWTLAEAEVGVEKTLASAEYLGARWVGRAG